ncbi:MAG: hypothetical protein AAB307_00285 [Deltaproteobacteria bacterium]
MDETIETVKVVRPDCPGGYVVINKEDLRLEDVLFKDDGGPKTTLWLSTKAKKALETKKT